MSMAVVSSPSSLAVVSMGASSSSPPLPSSAFLSHHHASVRHDDAGHSAGNHVDFSPRNSDDTDMSVDDDSGGMESSGAARVAAAAAAAQHDSQNSNNSSSCRTPLSKRKGGGGQSPSAVGGGVGGGNSLHYAGGPLVCRLDGCGFRVSIANGVSRHWRTAHLGRQSLAAAVFLEEWTGKCRGLFDLFPHVVICRVCEAIRKGETVGEKCCPLKAQCN